jgi:hypothetical protein
MTKVLSVCKILHASLSYILCEIINNLPSSNVVSISTNLVTNYAGETEMVHSYILYK